MSHRDWLTLRDLWLSHLPAIDFESKYPEPTLWELPTIQHPQLNASGTAECPYIDGVREAILCEAILLSRKFIYCGTMLPTLSGVGKNTWTAIAAYEASFYGAKALCYLLGFASLGRSSNLYLDAFTPTERKVGKVKVKVHETLRVHKLDGRLGHDVLWALTARLIDTTSFEGDLREIQTQLKIFDWDKFSWFRNSVFYDGSFWPLSATMANCDLTRGVHEPRMISASLLENPSSSAPFAGEYFSVASLLRDIVMGMLKSIAELAPAIKTEVEAFNVIGAPTTA